MDFNYTDIVNYDLSKYSDFKPRKSKYKYLDCVMSFDIETSSFFIDDKGNSVTLAEYDKRIKTDKDYDLKVTKTSLCYVWQFAIDTDVFFGRTLEQFVTFTELLQEKLDGKRVVVYVHNLSYEFQFIRKYFKWLEVFAMDNRKVLFAKTDFIDFKCSYLLSAKSLAVVASTLTDTNIKKMTGDLDYKLVRHFETPLTQEELGYCRNDVLIVNAYIKEQIKIYGRLDRIPLTNTGRVRRLCRTNCFKNKEYKSMIHNSLILTPTEFRMARYAFQGGFTHANACYTDLTNDNVSSYDFTSSYPTVMMSEKYPMSKGTRKDCLTVEQFESLTDKYCALLSIELYNCKTKAGLQPIISSSKCLRKRNETADNGRVYKADYIMTVITDVDYYNIKRFYDYSDIKIGVTYFYKKQYLPKEIITTILDLYGKKTTLKGLKNTAENPNIELEYLISKEMLNSLYGMTVFNPMKTAYFYENDEWTGKDTPIDKDNVDKYNTDDTRFTFYLWGVFVTAYARNNLFSGIYELKNDFIYADTDSVKILNKDKHRDYFENYDKDIIQKLENCMDFYKLDKELLRPCNSKGSKKQIGIWDYEGTYDRFKTLGAKRYLVEKDGEIEMTVSGLNKKVTVPYLLDKYKTNDNVFRHFTNSLYIPKEYTGKRVHTYIDDEQYGYVTDYQGKTVHFDTLSGIHLMECDYSMSILKDYFDFFKYIQNVSNMV